MLRGNRKDKKLTLTVHYRMQQDTMQSRHGVSDKCVTQSAVCMH
jgi:hypothetical protein